MTTGSIDAVLHAALTLARWPVVTLVDVLGSWPSPAPIDRDDDVRRLVQRRTWLASWGVRVLRASTIGEVTALLTETSQDLFGATGAWVLIVEGDALVGYPSGRHGEGPPAVRIPLAARTASTDALRARRVLVVNEYATSPYNQSQAGRQFRPAALMAVPLADDVGAAGVLLVHDLEETHRFGSTDVEGRRAVGDDGIGGVAQARPGRRAHARERCQERVPRQRLARSADAVERHRRLRPAPARRKRSVQSTRRRARHSIGSCRPQASS